MSEFDSKKAFERLGAFAKDSAGSLQDKAAAIKKKKAAAPLLTPEEIVDMFALYGRRLTTMDHPFDKQETRASIIITIRDILWKELPESYSDESINYYRDAVYNYISQHYGGAA